jgi:hypothetical protein
MSTKAIERAESYRSMMNTWAFKDFQENILKEHRQQALEVAISASTIEGVQINRGKVLEIDSILSELDSILEAK